MADMVKNRTSKQAPSLLTLSTQLDPNGQATSTVQVGWCVSPELRVMIEAKGYTNPYLVLVIRSRAESSLDGHTLSSYTETSYRVAKLTQQLDFVYFTRPGDNEVVPIIVNLSNKFDAERLGKLRHSSQLRLLDNDGTLNDDWMMSEKLPSQRMAGNFILEVKVPKEMFAKEPSALAKAFVGIFFHSRAVDQCNFRRWFIATLLLIVPAMILSMLARIVLLLGGLYMSWDKYSWEHVFKPWYGTPLDIFDDDGKFTMFKASRYDRRPWPFFVLNQYTIWAVPLAVFAVFNFPIHYTGSKNKTHPLVHWGWWQTFGVVNGAIVSLLLLVGIAVLLFMAALWVGDQLFKLSFFTKIRQNKQQAQARRQREAALEADRRNKALLRDLSAMVCTTGQKAPTSLDQLPADKKTVVLRFLDLKSKVCRPFAR